MVWFRKLIKLLNGTLDVQSSEGKGTEFSLSLSVKKVQVSEKAKPQAKNLSEEENTNIIEGLEILLIEDNKLNILITRRYLESWDIKCDVATTGFEALEYVRNTTYDLLLMDLYLPDLNGIDAIKELKTMENGRYQNLPVIMLTAAPEHLANADLVSLGIDDYLRKPFKAASLQRKISRIAGR